MSVRNGEELAHHFAFFHKHENRKKESHPREMSGTMECIYDPRWWN